MYISRDVVLDEQLFPFAHLHNNAGAQLTKEVVLFPYHLLNPGGVSSYPNIANAHANIPGNGVSIHEISTENLHKSSQKFIASIPLLIRRGQPICWAPNPVP